MPKQAGDELLKDLNAEQREAVTHGAEPLLIVAGAGTGKTTVITRRIAWLIDQGLAKPEEILALTFTDKAAQEMEERVDKLLPLGYVNVPISTFHAWGERVLKDWGLEIGVPGDFRVLTQTEQWMLMRNHLDEFALDYYRPLGNPARFIHALVQHFSRAKDEEVYPEDYLKFTESMKLNTGASEFLKKRRVARNESRGTKKSKKQKDLVVDNDLIDDSESESLRLDEVARAYHLYQKLLLADGSLDFGDLINYTVRLFRTRPAVAEHFRKLYKYILVDEFQDTNYAQYELLKLLAQPANNLTVVGDDDQSVYKFRGASISNILEFKQDYPQSKEIFLTKNYRSYQNILDTAYEFIQLNNPYRLEVKLREYQITERGGAKPRTEPMSIGSGTGVKLARHGQSLSKRLEASRTGEGEVAYLNFAAASDEAEGVIKKIIELKKTSRAEWSDFAILVRANSQAQVFLQALRRHQLPFDYVANRGLYSEPIILDVVAYLKLLDNYHESEALYRVLQQAPFLMPREDVAKLLYYSKRKTVSLFEALKLARAVGLSEEGLEVGDKLLKSLAEHTQLAREKSAAEVYISVINDLGINERLAHPAMVREAQYLTSFYQRIERFIVDSSTSSLNGFLKYLALEMESGEEGQLPQDIEEGPETVKIITVHSAKGLEWRYVFLVQLVDRKFPSTERREPIELPRELIKEVLPEGDVHLQEERRLFYVGLTRARDGVFLTRARDYFGKTTRKPSRFLYELGFVKEEEFKAPAAKTRVLAVPEIVVTKEAHYPLPESFSFSSISSFKKCPLEYKYVHLLKLPMPGSAALSFGSTMHKTLEQFLRLWASQSHIVQTDLFSGVKAETGTVGAPHRATKGGSGAGANLPAFEQLTKLYQDSWLDDWYDNPSQKKEYRDNHGPKQLKSFYEEFKAHQPKVKYLEQFFKLAFGPYKFVGKMDRLDEVKGGASIIDYKTGMSAAKSLEKVDRDQLIIYQLAAEEFLNEKVVNAQYWYLEPNKFSEPFVATQEQMKELKEEYIKEIEKIIRAIETDSFAEIHKDHEMCKYQHLG
ncbi:MAG: UvrD-helicase domain-containing protein [Candidatus Kerfeldbacteria bacterium]|nr:UvrD-helicase domain-containing protein [Candidatus Kerfeldbacteria bacterium]